MDERSDACCVSAKDPSFLVFDRDGFRNACPVVTITAAEYRELCGKAALWDEYRADVDRWAGERDA